jgi:DUF4097 and DUF4098 domain-containing protein YvlB
MAQQPRLRSLYVATGMAAAILLICGSAFAWDSEGKLKDEFHKTYPLSAQGRVELSNINGAVHIAGWDRNEVKVDAVKTAWTQQRLDEARIEVDANENSVSIRTKYPEHDHTFNHEDHDNPASVEYTITVPRQAHLEKIDLVNGHLEIEGVSGEVNANCVNGRIEARNLQGRAELKTVNGQLEATVDQLPSSELELSSVNGRLMITLPSDANAELEASTVSGNISDDFGLPVTHHHYVGHSLHGQLGNGGTLVKLSDVNGKIEIRHANDGRPLSPAKNLGGDSEDARNED